MRSLSILFGLFFVCLQPLCASAAITFVASNSQGKKADKLELKTPKSIVADDFLLAAIAVRGSTSIATPSGWTLLRSDVQGSTLRQNIYYKVATANDADKDIKWNLGGETRGVGTLLVYRGVDTADPIDAHSGKTTSTQTTSVEAPSVTTTQSDDMLVGFFALANGSARFSAPAGMTERSDDKSGGGGSGLSACADDEALTSSGATGIRSATAKPSNRSASNIGQLVALKAEGSVNLTCFTDTFDRANGAPGSDWQVSNNSGSFGDPRIVSNRLRLTDASNNVATSATLLRRFPGANNLVQVEFEYYAYAGSGADGVALTFSDAAIIPVPGGYGGSLGYANRCGIDGFTGGWLGVGIDEYGNFPNPTECRNGGSGFHRDNISLRGSGSAQSGYDYLDDTGTLNPGVDQGGSTPAPGHKYRITVDHTSGGVAMVGVERDTGGGYQQLSGPFDIFTVNSSQAAVPTDWLLSWTGSTGGSTNIHEIDNLQVCAAQILPWNPIDHIRFEHDGGALTCSPENIRIRICQDANCTSELTTPTSLTLSPSGWVGGDTQMITSGQTYQLRHTTAGTVSLGVSGQSARCFIGAVEQPNCDLLYRDSGFLFDVPDHTSAAPQTVTLAAVRKDLTTEQCVPGFAGVSKTVDFWSTYSNPLSGTLPLVINGTSISGSSPGTGLALTFDANGETQLNLSYADVGQLQLDASYTGTGTEAGLVMTGVDTFIASPASFHLTIPGNPAAANSSGGMFRKAGEPFNVQVEARNANGVAAPNYGQESAPESVRLVTTLVDPAAGNNPALSGSFNAFGTDCNGNAAPGVACGSFAWDEVGILDLLPGIGDSDYLGAGDVTGVASGNVGRFTPYRYGVIDNGPAFAHACGVGNFTYLGEEFGFASDPRLTITAYNAGSGITQNYGGGFWKLTSGLTGRSYANVATTAANVFRTTDGGNAAPSGTGTFNGIFDLTVSGDRLTYSKPATPENLFNASVDLDLTAADLTDSDGICYDSNGDTTCDPYKIAAITGTELRWGRIRLANSYGSELVDLQVPLVVEYFNGSGFITNSADACTTNVTIGPLTDVDAGDGLSPADTCVFDSGSPGLSGLGCVPSGPVGKQFTVPPLAGDFSLWFQPSGAGKEGSLDLATTVPAWLQYDWQGAGAVSPSARLTFGVYKGRPGLIYQRETY